MNRYLKPSNYAYALRRLLGIRRKPNTGKTPGQIPVFWTGPGGCGFLRTYDLLKTSGQDSIFFKSIYKLQNHNPHKDPASELLWERGTNESRRVQKYFKKEGVYDHHIAPYTLRYVPEIIKEFGGKVTILCLSSAKSAEALWIQWGYRNPLITDRRRRNRYPVEFYPDLRNKAATGKAAVEEYTRAYYASAQELQQKYPKNVHIVDADLFFTQEQYFTTINERYNLGLTFKKYELDCDSRVVTTSLDGGLGNNLFQMAEPVAFCAEHNLPEPTFGTWEMPHFPLRYRSDRFMGGHTGNSSELGETFPHIQWVPPTTPTFDYKFMLNDMFSFEDVHHMRDAILRYFAPSTELVQQLAERYPAIKKDKTISLHYRTGGLKADTRAFSAIPTPWYEEVFTSQFAEGYDCFVFSDNNERAKQLIAALEARTTNTYHLVEEGVFKSLVMMSMCKNHVLSNSTLSFWGAYLDTTQPAGITILHESFVKYHSEPHIECRMLPYPEWKLL